LRLTNTDVDSDDEPQGIELYRPPEVFGRDCISDSVKTFAGIVVDEVGQGTQEGCTLWWEEVECLGERHNFSFPLYSRSITVPATCVLRLT
jgi:hypothetical protein